jgi:ATP-dependent helicase IRC3
MAMTMSKRSIEMRPYQIDVHDALDRFHSEGGRRGVVNLPTGTGKTITGLDYARKKNGRLLWLAHRDELIIQPIRAMQAVWPEASTGIVKARQNEMDAQCVFATVQSLYRRLDQLPAYGPADLVVVDECHHAAADTYRQTLEAVGAFRPGGPPVIGLTATVERGDKRGLDDTFEKIVYQYQLLQAIRDGYLVDLKTERIHLDLNFDEVHTVGGDFNQGELDDALLRAGVAQAVAGAYVEYASDRKAIVFTVSVDQAKRTAAALQAEGVAAEWLSGSLPTEERRAILKRLKTGETQVVCNCMVLTEGFDEPTVDCVIVARPTKYRPLYIQMIGRGTRKAPGKSDCLVLDVTGVSRRHDLMTAPTLFGLKETESGETITEALDREEEQEKRERTEADRLRSIFSEDNELKGFRQLIRWLKVVPDVYALSAGDAGTVVLYPGEGGHYARVLKKYPEPDEMLTPKPVWLELAQGLAEDYLRQADVLGLIRNDAGWRNDPVTENQQRFLEKIRWNPGRPLRNKGDASDEITKAFVCRRLSIRP